METLEDYLPLLDAATSRGMESRALRQRNRYVSHNFPYRATARAQCDTTTRTRQYEEIHLFINSMVYFYLDFILYLLDKHLQYFYLPFRV